MSDAEVRIAYVVDPGNSEATIKQVEAASNRMVASVAKVATATSAQTSAAVQKALDSITAAEREMAAQVRASEAALKAKAGALGLSVSQLKSMESATRQTTRAAKAMDASVGSSAAAASNLRSQLFDIGQQLSAGTNPLVILSQQGPQIAEAMMGAAGGVNALKAALASTAAIIAPIAVTLGSLYVGWRIYSEDATRAKEITAAQQKAMEALRPTMDAVRDATIRLAVATGKLTEEQGKQAMASEAALRAFRASSAETSARLAELNKQQNSVGTQLVDLGRSFLDVVDVAGVNTLVFDALTTSSAELEQEAIALRRVNERHIDVMGEQVDLTHEAIAAEGLHAGAVKATAAAIKAAREEHERWIKTTMEQAERLAELLGIVVQAEHELDFFADAAERTANALPPSAIAQWRALGDSVDALAPAAALSRLDKLQLLLLDLNIEASKSAAAAAALADNIAAVQSAIGAETMAQQMALTAQATEEARAAAEQFLGILERAGTAAVNLASTIAGAFSTLTGGALDGLLSPAGAVSAAGNAGAEGGGAAVRAAMDAAVAFVQTVIAELPALLDALAGGIPHVLNAVIKGIPDIVQALVDAIPELFGALADKLPKLLIVLAEQVPVLLTAIIQALPGLVIAIVEAVPTIIQALVKGLPALFDAIFAAIPEIVIGVIEAIPDIVAAVLQALPTIVFGLIDAIFTELIPRLPEIAISMVQAMIEVVGVLAKDFVDKLKALILDIIPSIARDLMAAIKDLVTPGGKDKDKDGKTGLGEFFDSIGDLFGDTPGPIKAPMEGLRARFAPGDYVVSARTMEGLRAQVGPTPQAAQPAASPGVVRLDISDGHVAFDRLFRQNIQSGGSLASLRPATTGQTRIY